MVLQQEKILTVLNKLLGHSPKIRKGTDAVYFCPKCNHYKRKLEISLLTGKYHCWVCGFSGLNFGSLLKKLKASGECYELIGEVKKVLPSSTITIDTLFSENKEAHEINCLPEEFQPLYELNLKSLAYKKAIQYLKNRKITEIDVYRYNIGYCESGKYKNRIVVPSYDTDGILNFYSCRDFYDTSWLKYVNCDFSKDIIGFEMLTNFHEDVTLVEGAFDAIAVRKNAIPLFGKTLSNSLKLKLLIYRPPMVNILLDNDAFKDSLKICEFLIKNNINTRLVRLEEKDASVIGFEKTWEHIENSKVLDFETLFKLKINL
jgi:DNA primase